jgi:NAD(P)H-dependent flavin oxidoreductase YrpB (nitropropane dioxygenase family)
VDFREQIRRVRKATNKPFGVNFILALPHEEDLEVSLEERWLGNESRAQESRADEPVIGTVRVRDGEISIRRFMSNPPSAHVTGDTDSMALLAGQAVGLVNEIKPAATVMRELADEASRLIEHRLGPIVSKVQSA